LIKDKAANIWAATNNGLMLITALYASKIELEDIQLTKIAACECDLQNHLWFAREHNLYQLQLNNPGHYELKETLPADITCIYVSDKNHLWIGTLGAGVFLMNIQTCKLQKVNNLPELVYGHILDIEGNGYTLWVASLNGVDETLPDYENATLRRLRHHSKASGMSSDYIYQLATDNNGNMWMATDGGGVCMFDGKSYKHWGSKNGLRENVVYGIAIDKKGTAWAGTIGNSIYRFNGKVWQRYSMLEMSPRDNVAALKTDANGNVFIVSEKGVFEWFQNEKQFRVYNTKLGMHIDTTSTALNLIATDTASNMYIPFEHGFIKFNQLKIPVHITPDVHINTIKLDNEKIEKNRIDFSADENHLTFFFGAVNFSNPEKIYYRYQLSGYNNNWFYTGDNEVSFSKLAPGNYTFKIQASLSNDFLQASEDSFSFSIRKPFYAQVWFIVGLAFLIFSFGYYYQRIRNLQVEKLAQLQKERMIFEYEQLKSQVNPHFLFNSLNTLISLIEMDSETAVDYTVHLSDLYRRMLSFRDKDVILLAEEFEIIDNYMFIQQSRFGEALRTQINIPESYYKTKKIVPLALQLLVENAIKHNVVSRSTPLTIFIEANEQHITVINEMQPKISKEKSAGLGLINIHKRYGLLTSRKVYYGIENNKFVVSLPLL
jgi:ligand-binding sensor domain-containing protein